MSIKVSRYFKTNINKRIKKQILSVAKEIETYLLNKEVYERIKKANTKGTSSQIIQEIIEEIAKPLGFTDEKEGLFKKYSNSGLRPDFYKKLGKTGILMEVERGKTTTNNMDLLDIYKCHICEEASHLFLFVPIEVSHTKNIYKNVCKKVFNFFIKKNYLNIDSLIIYGY